MNRTDRTTPFFSGDNNDKLVQLNDILMTYVMYNFDLGEWWVILFRLALSLQAQTGNVTW